MARIPQSADDLRRHVAEHLELLTDAANRYDEGRLLYARTMATSLRVLLHQTNRSHALLDQVGRLATTRWLDTAGQIIESNLASTSGLIVSRVMFLDEVGSTEMTYVPVGDNFQHRTNLRQRTRSFGVGREPAAGRFLRFEDWWTTPVFRDGYRSDFSRKDLVLAIANQDGGAHVDPGIDEAYHRLSRGNSLGWSTMSGDSPEPPLNSPVPPAIRQITHEVLRSLPRSLHRQT